MGDQNPGEKVVRATDIAAPVAEGLAEKGQGVIRHLKLMASRRLRGGVGVGGEGGRGQYGRTFEGEHSCKQPLLVKVCGLV